MIACKAGPFIAEPSPRMKVSKQQPGRDHPGQSEHSQHGRRDEHPALRDQQKPTSINYVSQSARRQCEQNYGEATGRLNKRDKLGDVVREIISQDSPTSSIHVPMLDATVAIHSARKIGSARGLHGEVTVAESLLG
jgi:hypothetical protein